MTEEWKDIPGFEGIYQASNTGQIRTCEGKTTESVRHGTRHWKQRVLKQKCHKNAHGRADARVALYKGKHQYTFLVSRLVAMTWCAGFADGLTVNHIDGNHLNNNAENLEWVSIRENIQKGFADGLFDASCKTCSLIGLDGFWEVFNSYSEASRFLGRNVGYISNAVLRGSCVKDTSGRVYYVFVFDRENVNSESGGE